MFATWGRRKSPRGRRTSLLTRNLQLWVKMINILEYYVASEERKLSKTFRNLLLMLASVEITGVLGRQSASSFNPPTPPVAVSARPTTSGDGGGAVSKNLWERAQRPKVGGGRRQ